MTETEGRFQTEDYRSWEQIVIGGRFLHGKEAFQQMVDEEFGGEIPGRNDGGWFSFGIAAVRRPKWLWHRAFSPTVDKYEQLVSPPLPRFPKRLAEHDFFVSYDMGPPRNSCPLHIGFWCPKGAKNPYRNEGNRIAFAKGQALKDTKDGEAYREYVAKCRKAICDAWGLDSPRGIG